MSETAIRRVRLGGRATDTTDARQITLHTDYDELGRPTALTQGTTKRAAWEYDKATKGLGQLNKTTRYNGANAYINAVVNYNALYNPVVTTFTVPPAEGALAGTYEWIDVYNPHTGQLMETAQPAIGGLPAEDVVNDYTYKSSLPTSVAAGPDTLLTWVRYDRYGRPAEQQFGDFAQHLWKNNEYDEHTGALTRAFTDREVAPQRIDDVRYTYDPAGNIKRINTTTGQDTTTVNDTQCFALDTLRRTTEAWTATDNCAAAAPIPAVGGPNPYWTSYSYDAVGNRKTETQHTAAAGPATNTVRTYAAPNAGTHNLPGITQTGTNAHTEAYTYDETGNTKTRKIGNAATQNLQWDAEGHLESVTEVTDTTSYLYDTAGQRLIRRDSTGTTLYLPQGNELHLDEAGKAIGTRYYSAAGQTVAMRTSGKLTFLISDHHGTATTQVTADTAQKVSRRQSTIFGAPRGTQPTAWAGDKGFVGGTRDADTGLTHLGAREYDPATGRFISVDPIMDLADPQQTHGYTYANNAPATLSDPTGLRPDGICGGNSSTCVPSNSVSGASVTYNESWTKKKNGWYWKKYDENKEGKRYATHGCLGCKNWMDMTRVIPWTEAVDAVGVAIPTFGPGADLALGINDLLRGNWQAAGVRAASAFPLVGEARLAKNLLKKNKKCTDNSFVPGTKVLMADGSTKAIEDVKNGDKVLATDPETGNTEIETVTAEIKGEGRSAWSKSPSTSMAIRAPARQP